ncbi:MAG: hypothetical protein WCK49_08030 [Myxococcaceae bacterium]
MTMIYSQKLSLALLLFFGSLRAFCDISGIYFCSRDLERLSSKEKRENSEAIKAQCEACTAREEAYATYPDMAEDHVFVSYKDEDGSECHYIWRHCFLVQAEHLREVTIQGKRLLNLKTLDSQGFGGAGETVENEGIEGRFSESAVVYPEGILADDGPRNSTISCQLIYSEVDVKESELEKYDTTPHGVVGIKWIYVKEAMRQSTENGYDPFSHNCCTVAIDALKNVNPDIEKVIPIDEINFGLGLKNTGFSGVAFAVSKKTLAGLSKRSKYREGFYDDL